MKHLVLRKWGMNPKKPGEVPGFKKLKSIP
jgi:hypothetical protein